MGELAETFRLASQFNSTHPYRTGIDCKARAVRPKEWLVDKTPLPPSVKEKLSALNKAIFVQNGAEAAALYGAVLKEKPDFQLRGPVQYDLAQLLEKTAHRDLALTAYETIIEKQKDNKALFPATKSAGVLAFELKKFDKCMLYLGEFLKSKPPTAERQEAEEILSRLPPDHQKARRAADGDIQLDKIPSSSWSIGETPKPVTFEWKVESKKTPPPAKPKPAQEEGEGVISLEGLGVAPPTTKVDLPKPAQPRPSSAPALSPVPQTERLAPMRGNLAALNPAQPDALPSTQKSSPVRPTVPDMPAMMTPPPMPSPYYNPAGTGGAPGYPPPPPPGWYPPQPAPGYPAPPPGYPAEYGPPPGYPHPNYPPPAPGFYPQQPPVPYPVQATPPPPIPQATTVPVGPDKPESAEARFERLRDGFFALLIPIGKKIHLDAVAELVSRFEGISDAAAKKKVLKGKGLLYTNLRLQDVAALHPVVKLCRQSLVLVSIPRTLKSAECSTVLRAERRDKGLKLTTESAVRRMRWEEIRLINCGLVGNELLVVISGGDPLEEFRFKASSFDYSGFSPTGTTNFQAGLVEFLEILTSAAPTAFRSHIVEGLVQRKFTAPQPFTGWDEWDSYCDWVVFSHFAEKVDMEELMELNQVSSNW